MKQVFARIDSFNVSSDSLEELFCSENYIIEPVLGIGFKDNELWLETFGKYLKRNIIEAKILHTHTGLTLPIKRYSVAKTKQTLEVAGVHSFNEESKLKISLLKELWSDIQKMSITRLDVAIDFKNGVPKSVIRELKKSRVAFQYKHTKYLKTAKEKKSNPRMNILIYPKHIKDNFDEELWRLEFSFRGAYFNKCCVEDIDIIYKKMTKSIKRLTGLNLVIKPL